MLGVELNGARKTYAFSELAKALGDRPRGNVEDRRGGATVAIRYDRGHRSGQAFDGAARELPGVVGCWFAGTAFFPKTETFVAR